MTGGPRFDLTLGVVSHVPHWPSPDGQPLAYEPYVREMEVWARLFARVEILAPPAEWTLLGNQAAYAAANIHWRPVRYSNRSGPRRHLLRAVQLPGLRRSLCRLFETADLLLLRSPAPLTMLGRELARRRDMPRLSKWAGPLEPARREAPLIRLERAQLLRDPAPALVYGRSSRSQLVPFIPALVSEHELAAAAAAGTRAWRPPWQLLAVGRLEREKNFDLLLRGLAELRSTAPHIPWHLTIVGDGSQRAPLGTLCVRLGLSDVVEFAGAVPFAEVGACYGRAHVVVVTGTHEGWPKTIAEAWAHGAVAMGAATGIVPELLADGGGVSFEPSANGLARALRSLLADPDRMSELAGGGAERCRELTLERFERRLERVLVERLGLA